MSYIALVDSFSGEVDLPVHVNQVLAWIRDNTDHKNITLHGVTRTTAVTLSLRRDGTNVDVAGSVPVALFDFGIAAPKGYGALGSLAGHGTAEFLLILHRA